MISAEVGAYVALFLVENSGNYRIEPAHWDELDGAYHHWVERKIDRVLSLACIDGGPLLIAASRIAELCMVTPESRQRQRELDDALKAESGFSE